MSYLISLAEAKAFLQITPTTSDVLIQDYIDMVEGEISAVVGRNLALATYTEVVDYPQATFDRNGYTPLMGGNYYPSLFLKNYPITNLSIANVTSSNYNYNPANGVVTPTSYLSTPTVTYVAGYTTATAPSDLKLVAKMGVSQLYKGNGVAVMGNGNVKSKRIKDFSVEYDSGYTNGVKTYLSGNMAILNKYTSVNL